MSLYTTSGQSHTTTTNFTTFAISSVHVVWWLPGGPTGPGPGPGPGTGMGPGTTPMLGGCIIWGAPLTCIPGWGHNKIKMIKKWMEIISPETVSIKKRTYGAWSPHWGQKHVKWHLCYISVCMFAPFLSRLRSDEWIQAWSWNSCQLWTNLVAKHPIYKQ